MDKNTIIGFLLIGVVLIVFTWLNQPTPEQIEAQRRMQDSIAQIEYAEQLEQQKELNREAKADDELACPIPYGLPVYRTRLEFSPMQWLERRVPLSWKTSWLKSVWLIREDVSDMSA